MSAFGVLKRRAINDVPWLVRVDDGSAGNVGTATGKLPHDYLVNLPTPAFRSDTANHLWAIPVTDNEGVGQSPAGSAFIVSNKVMRNLQTGNF